MKRPSRKPNRLPEYDYSQNGAYFVTICTAGKKPLFWDPVGAATSRPEPGVGAATSRPEIMDDNMILRPPLSEYGRIAEQGIVNIPRYYPTVTVEKYCIMPNHIHLILLFSHGGGRLTDAPTLSRVVGQMKRWVSKQIGEGIWQKSYFDRVIRNDGEFVRIWGYIHENPQKYLLKEETI